MALFYECRDQCTYIVLDIANIVRDGDFSSTSPRLTYSIGACKSEDIHENNDVPLAGWPCEQNLSVASWNEMVQTRDGKAP